MTDDMNPLADWDSFLASHPEVVAYGPDGSPRLRYDGPTPTANNEGDPDTFVVRQLDPGGPLADDGPKWIGVQEGVMYASDMGSTVLVGWACPKPALERAAHLWHVYQHQYEGWEAAAEQLDQILEGMLTVMSKAYQIPAEASAPRWEQPANDDGEAEDDDE